MSLKKVLGLMLASRMAGRGGRRGGLGTAAMLGGGMGRKAGLASMAYLAYRAYQDHQSRSGGNQATGQTTGTPTSAQGGIGGMIGSVMESLTGQSQPQPAAAPTQTQTAPEGEDRITDAKALLLLQAMVAAAWADNAISTEERSRIIGQLDAAGADESDRRLVEREIAQPQPLDRLLLQVRDRETAEQFYLASRAAIDPNTPENKAYLDTLRARLSLSDEEVREVEDLTGGV
ncbi:tellurite resistance TerB family protein [Cereibacter changlensis]|uniref:Tellurite resistance TerB family protein n=1 Tax=Cereibacter changlensis TaxID=402884 RepID=A0A4U0YVH0_9RHOB|nr:DUF533 domain-containing protein [Cereibacter changlensis]TKA95688.1 tellurite resistance TerB family protein [Cereibacter changlensis]